MLTCFQIVMVHAVDLARLQKQEHKAKEVAEQLGLEFAKDAEELLRQAANDTRRNMDSAGGGPVSADSTHVAAC